VFSCVVSGFLILFTLAFARGPHFCNGCRLATWASVNNLKGFVECRLTERHCRKQANKYIKKYDKKVVFFLFVSTDVVADEQITVKKKTVLQNLD